jgi:hypothetical protein
MKWEQARSNSQVYESPTAKLPHVTEANYGTDICEDFRHLKKKKRKWELCVVGGALRKLRLEIRSWKPA